MIQKKLNRRSRKILMSVICLLMVCFRKFGGESGADYAFKKIWGFISNNGAVGHLFLQTNRWVLKKYQLQKNEYLIFELAEAIRKRGLDYTPNIYPEDMALWKRFSVPEEKAIIVSVHTGFAFNLRILSDMGRKVCTISSHRSISDTFARSGVKHPVRVIKNDRYCLAYLKEAILDGSIACCAIDFKQGSEMFEYISPTLFDLSHRLKVPIYFSKSYVLSDGSLSVRLMSAPENCTPVECAQKFIGFINESSNPARVLSVRADDRKRSA